MLNEGARVPTLVEQDPGEVAARIVEEHRGETAWLDEFVDELDRRRAGAALERVVRVWGLSQTEAGHLFGVSRQALRKWIDRGVPADRAAQVADAARATDLLVRHLKRDRIPAVVRRPAPALGDASLVEVFASSGPGAVLDATREMFDFTDAHA